MRLRSRRVFSKPGISQRISVHPWNWPIIERLSEVRYPRRYPPPPGHPLQCQGLIVSSFTQCDRWAKKNSSYCGLCFANRPVSKLYEHEAGPTLKAMLERAADGAPEDRLSVVAEIDLARCAATEAVRLFSAVLDAPNTNAETRAASVNLLHTALREVRDLVKAQSAILSNVEGLVTTEQYLYMVETMKKVVRDALPESAKAEEICERIDLMQLPSKGVAEKAISVSFT